MSQENLELLRSLYATWARGDYSSIEWADPEIEYVIVDGPAPGRWKGLAGLAEGWSGFMSAWDDLRTEVDEFRELDEERVLVLAHHSGRGRTSGVELGHLSTKAAGVFHIRNGKVTRFVTYWDHRRGLSDLGLSE